MTKNKKTMVTVRLHNELFDYIKSCSEREFTTVSGYLTRLILDDKNKNQQK